MSFDVLDAATTIRESRLIQASAGTGKTFTIEHLVLRWILEEGELGRAGEIDQVLVVTFTRAATRELRMRIRALLLHTEALLAGEQTEGMPSYLIQGIEQGKGSLFKKRCRKALMQFEQAQIFTIHGFCHRMLSLYAVESSSPPSAEEDQAPDPQFLRALVRDFFRTGLLSSRYSVGQLQSILSWKKIRNDMERLIRKISLYITQEKELSHYNDSDHVLDNILTCMEVSEEEVLPWIRCYKGVCSRSGEVKPELKGGAEALQKLFSSGESKEALQELLSKGGKLLKLLVAENLSKRAKMPEGGSVGRFIYDVVPQLLELLDPVYVLGMMVEDCKKLLAAYEQGHGSYTPDRLLRVMGEAITHAPFVEKVRELFRFVLVDEFQDTDPVQWTVLSTLFLHHPTTTLYLVGDPKQSIYSFREADVYTYLQAACDLGEHAQVGLHCNYRSTPQVIEGLNHLFDSAAQKGFFALPALETALPYPSVTVPQDKEGRQFVDGQGSVHFFAIEGEQGRKNSWPTQSMEEELLFPYVLQQTHALIESEGYSYSDIAVLVRDRFQGERFQSFCASYGVPVMALRPQAMGDSVEIVWLAEILEAIWCCYDLVRIRSALSTPFFGWTGESLASHGPEKSEVVWAEEFACYRKRWQEHGLLPMWRQLVDNQGELLLQQEGGRYSFERLQQLVEHLADWEQQEYALPEQVLHHLGEVIAHPDDDPACRYIPEVGNGVKLITIHSSKGLEFPIVFPIGLIARSHREEELFPLPDREYQAEKNRQLYVALTRAKDRLYIPVAYAVDSPTVSDPSPMELFLESLLGEENSVAALEERVVSLPEVTFCSVKDTPLLVLHKELASKEQGELFAPQLPTVPHSDEGMHSFSSLTKNSHKERSELSPPHAFDTEKKSAHTLPAGSETGNLVHELLDGLLSLSAHLHGKELREYVESRVADTPYAPWSSVLEAMLVATLSRPWDDGFCLYDVPLDQLYSEVDFTFSGLEFLSVGADSCFRGIIDLLFLYKGKYYLVDWKTNWLGEDESAYSEEAIDQAMEREGYHAQARIYTEALQRYLAVVEPRPFADCFGGVHYLFLRGIGANIKEERGTWV